MAEIAKVKDVMTTKVLSVKPEDGLDVVSGHFDQYDYDGIPVVSPTNKLLGIITAYDMIVQSSGMHLPTVVNIMEKMSINQADRKDLDEYFGTLRKITASQIMNAKPLTVDPDISLQDAAKIFAEHHRVNPICVVDASGKLAGVLSRYDIIKFFNEKYLQQVVADKGHVRPEAKKADRTESDIEIETAVGNISKKFLIVTKRRKRLWKFIAFSMFIAGVFAAMSMVISVVYRQDDYNLIPTHKDFALLYQR